MQSRSELKKTQIPVPISIVLYNSDAEMANSRTEFVEWWLNTEFGSKKNTVRWNGKKKTDIWEQFEQVAHEKTGEPKAMCKKCQAVLVHPHHRRAGTSPMHIHLKGDGCHGGPKKQSIDQLLRSSVSYKYP